MGRRESLTLSAERKAAPKVRSMLRHWQESLTARAKRAPYRLPLMGIGLLLAIAALAGSHTGIFAEHDSNYRVAARAYEANSGENCRTSARNWTVR